MNGQLVAFGRIRKGKSEMVFDRTHFQKEGTERHLTEAEFKLIQHHVGGGDQIPTAVLEGYGLHVKGCKECGEKILSIPRIVFDEESVHTSLSPDKAGSIYSKPDHEEKFVIQDITDWDDEIIH
ncbi:MAG TPA: hypothetical protein PKD34_02030 [Candidatus Doudnabacteria bacterium]|nr:hypothetical protein [Candidatus Doudnabacteria bacterium]